MTGERTGAPVPDLVTAAVLLAVAAGVFVETAGYPGSLVPGAPGPAFFPRFLAGGLGVLALLLAWGALRAHRAGEDEGEGRGGLARIGLSLVLVVVFLLAVGTAGFFLLLPPLLAAVMAVMGERRPWALVGVPLLFDLFVYVVFYRLFSVDLPTLFL